MDLLTVSRGKVIHLSLALSAAKGLFPECKTPIQNLFTWGASNISGIRITVVSARGAYAAEKIIGKKAYKTLLKK